MNPRYHPNSCLLTYYIEETGTSLVLDVYNPSYPTQFIHFPRKCKPTFRYAAPAWTSLYPWVLSAGLIYSLCLL